MKPPRFFQITRMRDVPPVLSSAKVWSPIPHLKEIGHEEALFRRANQWLPARGGSCTPVKELCRKHAFSEASYYLWRSKFGGMSVPDAKSLKKLLA
jgi:hypothetical protein